jgi:Heterokaryon incompatibility protein (HET)
MRLLEILPNGNIRLTHNLPDSAIPQYAILSHRWGDEKEEVTFEDMAGGLGRKKAGYKKIKFCSQQATRDGFQYIWVDTCCIDKRSSAELSESINSMFRWYQQSAICYAYLCDVPDDVNLDDDTEYSAFVECSWFTRGWTLQELIAPRELKFYSTNWIHLGDKRSLRSLISDITGIDGITLALGTFDHASVAQRMSWASNRHTTRVEDIAYCLLGIFGINMPLLYGEKEAAFIRLQEEIAKNYDDDSLFAWSREVVACYASLRRNTTEDNRVQFTVTGGDHVKYRLSPRTGRSRDRLDLLAESPADFASCGDIVPLRLWPANGGKVFVRRGERVQIQFPLLSRHNTEFLSEVEEEWSIDQVSLGLLGCRKVGYWSQIMALVFTHHGENRVSVNGSPVLLTDERTELRRKDVEMCVQVVDIARWPREQTSMNTLEGLSYEIKLSIKDLVSDAATSFYTLAYVHCFTTKYDPTEFVLWGRYHRLSLLHVFPGASAFFTCGEQFIPQAVFTFATRPPEFPTSERSKEYPYFSFLICIFRGFAEADSDMPAIHLLPLRKKTDVITGKTQSWNSCPEVYENVDVGSFSTLFEVDPAVDPTSQTSTLAFYEYEESIPIDIFTVGLEMEYLVHESAFAIIRMEYAGDQYKKWCAKHAKVPKKRYHSNSLRDLLEA